MKPRAEVRAATSNAVSSAGIWTSFGFLFGLFLLIAWCIVAG